MTQQQPIKPAAFILAGVCFAIIMMIYSIHETIVYFVGHDLCLDFAVFLIVVFFMAAMLGFIFDALGLPKTGAEHP